MKPSRALMVVRLLLAVSLLVPASAGWCAATQERYIKRLGVDDKYINLEVDGEKVHIPLPEGYEVFTKEDYPEQYEHFYGSRFKEIAVPLCGLVNSSDHKMGKNISNDTPIRFSFVEIQRAYIPHRLSNEQFRNEMEHKKKYRLSITAKNNASGKDRFRSKYIIDDQITLTEINVEKKEIFFDDYIMAFTTTHFLFKKLIITIRLYSWLKNEDDAESLIEETSHYIDLLTYYN